MRKRNVRWSALAAAVLALSACGGDDGGGPEATPDTGQSWAQVLADAEGQTVDWHMYGGDEGLNTFISDVLAPRMEEYGITLNQVKINDAADVISKLLGEKQAGREEGSVDLMWINGENFASGKQADLWHCGYPEQLPNSEFVDFADPAVSNDFGTPVEGCESVWQQANSALVYDSAAMQESDVASVESLLAWAERNPGQFTYPAPPDFTGSMAVRTFLYATAGGPEALGDSPEGDAFEQSTTQLWERLQAAEPSLWRGGDTYPSSQDEVEKLYGDGQVKAFFTYGPGAVAQLVEDGVFPETTREAVLDVGNIANNSFVAIPWNATDKAAAKVLANELLDPEVQRELFEANGAYPAIDLERAPAEDRAAFEAIDLGPSVLPLAELTENTRPELPADFVGAIEDGWKSRVLQE